MVQPISEIEWSTEITNKIQRGVRAYVSSPKNSEKPVQERLREAYGIVITLVDSEDLNKKYGERKDFVPALNAYKIAGAFITNPVAGIKLIFSYQKSIDERVAGKMVLDATQVVEYAGQLIAEDVSGFQLVEQLTSLLSDSSGGVAAATTRFKQLYNHFSQLFEI